jgi:threonine dehydrogenase-like Zn-dependent dehydrogenase
MQIIVCEEPGKMVLTHGEKPAIKEGYAQIRIRRIGVCGTDLHAFEGTQPYFNYPRILGHELSGELVEPNGAPGFKKGEIVTFTLTAVFVLPADQESLTAVLKLMFVAFMWTGEWPNT